MERRSMRRTIETHFECETRSRAHIGSIAAGLGARTVESVADVTVSHAMGMVMIDVYHLKEQSSFDQYSNNTLTQRCKCV